MAGNGWTLITGASSGIGAAFADVAAREGSRLIITARRVDRLDDLASRLKTRHSAEVVTIPADLAKPDGPSTLWQQASDGREIDMLVNNAGLGRYGLFADGGWEQECSSIAVNVLAAAELTKLAVPPMVERGRGRILQISSVASFVPGPRMAVYHGTKAFLTTFSESLAEELRGTGVTVTIVCPGVTTTEFQAEAGMDHLKSIERGPKQSAEDVAEYAWRAAMRGAGAAIPGLANKGVVLTSRGVPRALLARIMGMAMKD